MAKKSENLNEPKTLDEALQVIAEKNKQIKDLVEVVDTLKEDLSEAKKSSDKNEKIVEFKGVKYKIKAKNFNYNGKVYKAEILLEDNKMLAELIELGAGYLEQIVEVEE